MASISFPGSSGQPQRISTPQPQGKETEENNKTINQSDLKTVLSAKLPTEQKLKGSENWPTWHVSLATLLNLFGIYTYFESNNNYQNINTYQKAIALFIIRQNISEKPLNLILTELDPLDAYTKLKAAYEGSGPVIRQQLYIQIHQLKLEQFKNNLTAFISKFESLITQLRAVGSVIQDTDLKILFISIVSKQFPIWAERQRANLRNTNPPSLEE